MDSGGWDSGQVYVRSIFPGEPSVKAKENTVQEFFDFIQNFRDGNLFIYREQLRANLAIGKPVLRIEILDLSRYDAILFQKLLNEAPEMTAMFEEAAYISAKNMIVNTTEKQQTVPRIQVEIISNSNTISLRELNSSYISKLVCVSGIVIGASTLSSKATYIYLQCRSCAHVKIIPVSSGFSGIQIPRYCEKPVTQGSEKCPIDSYEIIPDKCIFIDQQTLKLQELPDSVPVGELPRHLVMSADRNLVNQVFPGARVTVTGIFSVYQSKSASKTQGAIAIRNPYLRVIGMEIIKTGNSSASKNFSPEEEKEMLAISRIPNIYQVFSDSIAPSIFGNSDIKKSIACLLFGGSKKVLPDGTRLRGDINVLLLGDPGTAKSQLLKFVEKAAPISIYTSGKGSSAAGLTASVIKDPSTRELYLEGGAMVLADGGVVCIDEFDKMRDEDRVAIHEAMEQQTISIAKAGITTVLNARSSVLAAANPVFGRYDDSKATADNIDFQTSILSRFDCIFIVKDEHDEARDRTIAEHVLQVHAGGANQTSVEGELTLDQMSRYITYCRSSCAPRLTAQASERLGSFFVNMRGQISRLERDTAERSAIPITVRQLEAIIRLSESLAKMALSPVCNVEHVEEAIRLFRVSTMHAAQSTTVDGITYSEFSKEIKKIENDIRRRLPIGSQLPVKVLKSDFIRQGYSQNAIEQTIFALVRQDTLQYKNHRHIIQRVGA
ncbi:hypothetical protein BB560_001234 [Smittium megazygosporum]|uniref:DNA replication licensing factor MCM5 n=1 Tax=Smittium megazygosporum TaxID=133381 RepID=A0A2T9ZI63_9FUNG|nr:hypothetical protein BB560_001234 [Smittium megazygosporum]